MFHLHMPPRTPRSARNPHVVTTALAGPGLGSKGQKEGIEHGMHDLVRPLARTEHVAGNMTRVPAADLRTDRGEDRGDHCWEARAEWDDDAQDGWAPSFRGLEAAARGARGDARSP